MTRSTSGSSSRVRPSPCARTPGARVRAASMRAESGSQTAARTSPRVSEIAALCSWPIAPYPSAPTRTGPASRSPRTCRRSRWTRRCQSGSPYVLWVLPTVSIPTPVDGRQVATGWSAKARLAVRTVSTSSATFSCSGQWSVNSSSPSTRSMTCPTSGPGRTRVSCRGVSRPGTSPAAAVIAVLAVGPSRSTGTASPSSLSSRGSGRSAAPATSTASASGVRSGTTSRPQRAR